MQRHSFVALAFMAACVALATPLSYAVTPEVETMELKGYSPDTIDLVMHARSQAEWRGIPAPRRSPVEMVLYNLIHNDWTGTLDQPGYSVIRRD
jgi:hypothetical protein